MCDGSSHGINGWIDSMRGMNMGDDHVTVDERRNACPFQLELKFKRREKVGQK